MVCCILFPAPVLTWVGIHRSILCVGARVSGGPRVSCLIQLSSKTFSLQFIQPPGTPPTEVLQFTLPPSALPWLQAVAYYLRQNLLIFLHTPKYTDSNVEHHFKVRRAARGTAVDSASICFWGLFLGQLSCCILSSAMYRKEQTLNTQTWRSFSGLWTVSVGLL